MNTFLLVWNPKRWGWRDLATVKSKIINGKQVIRDWSCGNTKKISVGDRVFIIRLGKEPKGIFASGTVEEERHQGPHWDPEINHQIWYLTIKLDKVLDPKVDNILYRANLDKGEFQPMHWDSQMSGIQIPSDVARHTEIAWREF